MRWGVEFLLRHYLSGLYLSAVKIKGKSEMTLVLVSDPDDRSIFELEMVKRGFETKDSSKNANPDLRATQKLQKISKN